jgi:hypothetical protein
MGSSTASFKTSCGHASLDDAVEAGPALGLVLDEGGRFVLISDSQ